MLESCRTAPEKGPEEGVRLRKQPWELALEKHKPEEELKSLCLS